MSLGGGGSGVWLLSMTSIALLVQTARAASQEHNNGSQEDHDHSSQEGPDTRTPCGLASIIHIVDLVTDDAEEGEIGSENDDGDDEGEGGHNSRGDGTNESAAERKEEGNECEAASNRVEYHNASQGFRGVLLSVVEFHGGDGVHLLQWVVADCDFGAVVIVVTGLYVSICCICEGGKGNILGIGNVQDAVSEGAKGDGGAGGRCAILEGDAEDGDVIDDGRGDCGDEEKGSCNKEEERADVVEDTCCHCEGFEVVDWLEGERGRER